MEIKQIIYTGLLFFITQSCFVETARRGTRRPGRNNAQQSRQNYAQDTPTQQRNMNVGSLSDAIMNALQPRINDMASGVGVPSNRNNRGNANGRQYNTMPQEPAEVNLTLADIIEQYPWIENPESVVHASHSTQYGPNSFHEEYNVIVVETNSGGSHSSSGPDSGNGGNNPSPTNERPTSNYRPNRNRNDGRTRFNNPRYLRDQLEGLNRDDYDFKVTQGVKVADGNYKVKLLQAWRNLPIYGTSLVLEQERDANLILESADGVFLSGIEDDITSEVPRLSKDQALERALAFNRDQGKPIQNPRAKLIVDTIGDKAVLAYLIDYFVPGLQQPRDPITVMPSAAPTQPPTETPTTNFATTSRWRGRSRRRRCRNQRRRGRGNYRACMNRGSASSESPGLSVEDTTPFTSTFAPTEALTIEQIQNEFRREYSEDKQVDGEKREFLVVDANTGEVLRKWTGLASAIGMSRIPILVGLQNAPRRYEEFVRRNDVTDECFYQRTIGSFTYLTVQDHRLPSNSFRNAFSFLCPQAVSTSYDTTNGATSPRNSAYKWASEALNFFRRAGNVKIRFNVDVEVHHPGFGAFWTGDKVVLGDGDSRFYYPMTGPDIVVHEIAHAFTEHNSGLRYVGQSGAIDEAYSDMAACAFLNYFFADDTPDVYRIGTSVSKVGVAMRDMCNPGSRNLVFYDPTKPVITSALQWTSTTRIHNASALYNKAFCELSKSRGWNIFLAFKVFTAANLVYWTPNETFNTGACGVRKAAGNLMGTEQAKNDVDRAFAAVDIACPPGWTY